MTRIRPSTPSRFKSLPLALMLGVAVAALSYVRRIGDMNSAAFHSSMINTLLAGQFWGTALARNVMLFIGALVLIHMLFGLLCWGLACASARAWPHSAASRAQWVWFWVLLLTGTLLLSNAIAFPNSSLGEPYTEIANTRQLGLPVAGFLAAVVALGAAATLLTAMWRQRSTIARSSAGFLLASALCILLLVAAFNATPEATGYRSPKDTRPNVILVGIDSLRNDLLPVDHPSTYAPNIGTFLHQSVRFSNATTPLARTYPSWLSILTGEHPHTTGGALNLLPLDLVRVDDTLGFTLRRAGYRTVYGIDETRFSNIDESYGFDQTITPPMGASEFLIAWFGDAPLLNFLVNTRLGQLLFPRLHANRGAATTYDPDSYIHRIARELPTDDRPLFLALHLTLAHWPYTWKDSLPLQGDGPVLMHKQYLHAVQRVDAQFHSLMRVLGKRGLLQNAIVIVLSDHGESFVPGSDSIGPADNSTLEALDAVPGWGHGSSVFAPDQFRVVLGLQLPATIAPTPGHTTIDAPVSLEDIAPTLYALLGITASPLVDGQSLLPLIDGRHTEAFNDRVRFTESEFTPKGLLDTMNRVSTSVIARVSQYYQIDPRTDRMSVRRELVSGILANRQFAAFTNRSLLAAIPDTEHGAFSYILVRDPFHSNAVVERIDPTALTQDPDAQLLWRALQSKFAIPLAHIRTQMKSSIAEPRVATTSADSD